MSLLLLMNGLEHFFKTDGSSWPTLLYLLFLQLFSMLPFVSFLLKHYTNICIRKDREGHLSGSKGPWPSQWKGRTTLTVLIQSIICFRGFFHVKTNKLSSLLSTHRMMRLSHQFSPLTSSMHSHRRSVLARTQRNSSRICESLFKPACLLMLYS